MSALYERPTHRGPGDLPLLRHAAEITAADTSVLSDDITDLANLIRAGLPVDAERGFSALDAYEEAARVLRARLEDYLTAGGTDPIPVTIPTYEDVLTVLGTADDDRFGRLALDYWLTALEHWLRTSGAVPQSRDPKVPTTPASIEDSQEHLHQLAEAAADEVSALRDEIAARANLVRAGLPREPKQHLSILDGYAERVHVLAERLGDYRAAGGTNRVSVMLPTLDDLRTILGAGDDDRAGHRRVLYWRMVLGDVLRSSGATPHVHDLGEGR